MAIKPEEIKKSNIILCEGADCKHYVISLLNAFGAEDERFKEYQAMNFGGINELRKYLPNFVNMEGYERVKTITIIRDAEASAESARKSVIDSLNEIGFDVPLQAKAGDFHRAGARTVGFLILPDIKSGSEDGTLEDLCLRTLARASDADEILSAVNPMIDRLKLKRPHKNRLHAYFSLTDEYVALKIGEAAAVHAFDFGCPEILELKCFLSRMLSAGIE
ncbi:MAG: hypothetical protein LBR38_04930 [Synergistaceae bacterium]|nr:hypothetical protein [Synergistaceae bacterium]